MLFYLFAYMLMNLAAFSALMATKRGDRFGESLEDLSGLGRRRPAVAFAMLVLMLSLAGIPPTIGFFAKFYVFAAAIQAKWYGLAVIGVINTVIGIYYYIRVIITMYAYPPDPGVAESESSALSVALGVACVCVLALGIFPTPIFNAAVASARVLF